MLVGPVFTREAVISPRRYRTYIARTAYVAGLGVLAVTAWVVLAETQIVRNVGDMARFGAMLFQVLVPLQLGLALFFSSMLAASAVAQEKDRRTLVLLLLTRLSNSELVLGRLLASLLNVISMLAAAVPLFLLATLFGGISVAQIARVFAVTLLSVIVCGSLGSTIALWRDKTFQALAMTVMVLVLWLGVWELVASGALGESWWGLSCRDWAVGFSPWQAIFEASRPRVEAVAALGPLGTPVNLFLLAAVGIAAALNFLAVAMVRVWNPSREARPIQREEDAARPRETIWGAEHDAEHTDQAAADQQAAVAEKPRPAATTRRVWDNPVIWREIRTWAYGRKILMIRLVYLVLFALAAASLYSAVGGVGAVAEGTSGAKVLVPLLLLSLVMVNAQAVTSMTSERDGKAIDLLLVTDLSPKEIVFGKLGGVFYNTKEMVLLPILPCAYLTFAGVLSLENLVYLLAGLAVLFVFVAVLGVHAGMVYTNSRSAIGTSLGTVFFLFVGVATCMQMMIAFSGSFEVQVFPFVVIMIGGGVGLYVALGARNPSNAIGAAAFLCPIATFYAITSFMLGQMLAALLVTVAAYGFTTAAMLVPAIYEFDVAAGRTTADE